MFPPSGGEQHALRLHGNCPPLPSPPLHSTPLHSTPLDLPPRLALAGLLWLSTQQGALMQLTTRLPPVVSSGMGTPPDDLKAETIGARLAGAASDAYYGAAAPCTHSPCLVPASAAAQGPEDDDAGWAPSEAAAAPTTAPSTDESFVEWLLSLSCHRRGPNPRPRALDVTSLDVTSLDVTSLDVTSLDFTSLDFTSLDFMSLDLAWTWLHLILASLDLACFGMAWRRFDVT